MKRDDSHSKPVAIARVALKCTRCDGGTRCHFCGTEQGRRGFRKKRFRLGGALHSVCPGCVRHIS